MTRQRTNVWLYGRECKLGYGLTGESQSIVSLESGDGLHIKETYIRRETLHVSDVSSEHINFWQGLHSLLSDSYLMWLENQIVMDDEDYYLVDVGVLTRYKACQNLGKCPEDLDLFGQINRIDYGVDISLVVSARHWPKGGLRTHAVEELWDEITRASKAQDNIKCRMLVNFSQSYEIQLKHLLTFVEEIKQGRQKQCECAVLAHFTPLKPNGETKKHRHLQQYLGYLYICYRKIEMRAAKVKYPLPRISIDVEQGSGPYVQQSHSSYSFKVNALLAARDELNDLDTARILDVYPVVKKVFLLYMECLDLISSSSNVGMMLAIPGDKTKIQDWLTRLNTWNPRKHY